MKRKNYILAVIYYRKEKEILRLCKSIKERNFGKRIETILVIGKKLKMEERKIKV